MFQLLTRFAWFLSLFLGFFATLIFFILFGDIRDLGSVHIFLFFVYMFIGTMLCKRIFLSKTFIESRLTFFSEALTKMLKQVPEEMVSQKSPEKEAVTDMALLDVGEPEMVIPINTLEPVEYKKIMLAEPSMLKKFFSENLLAKLGGILVFLGVLFFLSLVYGAVGPVAKIIIGFGVGFGLFGVGVFLDTKELKNEARILFGVGIVVNYLVILSGRYLLGDEGYLSETTTFLFLILNTLFAVLVSFIYRSQILLVFSFVFAYLNPLLIGGSSDNPYTLLGYTLIVSAGAFFISYKQKDLVVLVLSFLLGNLLILISPISLPVHYLAVIVILNIFNLMAISSSIHFQDKHKSILEFVFGGAFFALAFFNYFHVIDMLSSFQFIIIGMSSLLFLVFSYYLSSRAPYLYSLGTAGGILTLFPLIEVSLYQGIFIQISVIFIILFALLNLITPFINKKFIHPDDNKSTINLFIGTIFGAIFLVGNIYAFGELYFPGLVQGMAFLGLAIVYFIQSFILVQRLGIENIKKSEHLTNVFYNFAGISISIFSIAIAFIFSKYPEIISTVWLFEATLLFYFFSKTKSFKIYLIAIVLFIIGVSKLGFLLNVVEKGDFLFFISFAIIFMALILNIKFLSPRGEEKQAQSDSDYVIWHSIIHIIAIGILAGLLLNIIPSSGHGWSTLGIGVFVFLLALVYSYFSSLLLKVFFLVILTGVMLLQIGNLDSVLANIGKDDLGYLRILQYLTTGLFIGAVILWKKYNKQGFGNISIQIILGIYLLIITSAYIYDIFNNTFMVTIYWGVISSIFLWYGISKDMIRFRTLGLYLVSLTALKIFLYDIWFGIDDAIMRVVALIVIGILFIIISTNYTKRFGNNMSGEFDIQNLNK